METGSEPVYTSLKIGDKLKLRELKPALVTFQWVVDMFIIVICRIMQIIWVSPHHHLHQRGYDCKAVCSWETRENRPRRQIILSYSARFSGRACIDTVIDTFLQPWKILCVINMN